MVVWSTVCGIGFVDKNGLETHEPRSPNLSLSAIFDLNPNGRLDAGIDVKWGTSTSGLKLQYFTAPGTAIFLDGLQNPARQQIMLSNTGVLLVCQTFSCRILVTETVVFEQVKSVNISRIIASDYGILQVP